MIKVVVSWCKNKYSIIIESNVFKRLVFSKLFSDEVMFFVVLFIINKLMFVNLGFFLVFLIIFIIVLEIFMRLLFDL